MDLNRHQPSSSSAPGLPHGASTFPSAQRSSAGEIKRIEPLDLIADFEARFPQIFELFKTVGIHPLNPAAIIDPYTMQPVSESFANVGEHCVAVAHCASQIAGALERAGIVSAAERDKIIERALVHDLSKPYEILRRNAQRGGAAIEVYSVSAYEKLHPHLLQLGFPEELATYLVNAGKETGHNSIKDLIAVKNGAIELRDGILSEMIIHLADDMTFTDAPPAGQRPFSAFLTPWERILASNFIAKYPWLWQKGLGSDAQGALSEVADVQNPPSGISILGHYANLQVRCGDLICRKIQELIDPASTQDASLFVKELVNR